MSFRIRRTLFVLAENAKFLASYLTFKKLQSANSQRGMSTAGKAGLCPPRCLKLVFILRGRSQVENPTRRSKAEEALRSNNLVIDFLDEVFEFLARQTNGLMQFWLCFDCFQVLHPLQHIVQNPGSNSICQTCLGSIHSLYVAILPPPSQKRNILLHSLLALDLQMQAVRRLPVIPALMADGPLPSQSH